MDEAPSGFSEGHVCCFLVVWSASVVGFVTVPDDLQHVTWLSRISTMLPCLFGAVEFILTSSCSTVVAVYTSLVARLCVLSNTVKSVSCFWPSRYCMLHSWSHLWFLKHLDTLSSKQVHHYSHSFTMSWLLPCFYVFQNWGSWHKLSKFLRYGMLFILFPSVTIIQLVFFDLLVFKL